MADAQITGTGQEDSGKSAAGDTGTNPPADQGTREKTGAVELTDDTMVAYKVNGEVVTRRYGDVKNDLSKVGGADERFREAAELHKQAKKGIEIIRVTQELQREDLPKEDMLRALDRYYELMGYSEETRKTALEQWSEVYDQQAATQAAGGGAGQPEGGTQEAPKPSPEEVERAKWIDEQRRRERRAEIDKEIDSLLTKDPEYAKLKSSRDPRDKEKAKVLRELTHKEVQRRVVVREVDYGPDAVVETVQSVKALLKPVLGIGTPDGTANPPAPETAQWPTVGPIPGAPPVALHPEPPPDRVSCTGPGSERYTQNFAARLSAAALADRGATLSEEG